MNQTDFGIDLVPSTDTHRRRQLPADDSHVAFVDEGVGPPIVFLHGNPTSSYLWRNVITPLCASATGAWPPTSSVWGNPAVQMDANIVSPTMCVISIRGLTRSTLARTSLLVTVGGATFAFHRARRQPPAVAGIAYCEPVVGEREWSDFPDSRRAYFQSLRSTEGERLVLEENTFVEAISRSSVQRDLTPEEMARYRAPFAAAGSGRLANADVSAGAADRRRTRRRRRSNQVGCRVHGGSGIPKLLLVVSNGTGLTKRQREECRRWPNQHEVASPGKHFVQEDSPVEMAAAIIGLCRARLLSQTDRLTNQRRRGV